MANRREMEPARSTRPGGVDVAAPVELTSFVGRVVETEAVGALLDADRMITLTGPGGCGKTRLAQRVATQRAEVFDGQVFWTELAPIVDGSSVAQAVRAAVGAHEQPGRTPTESASTHLGKRRALLILDNCEHVLPQACEVAQALLATCPGLVVLATSRERVGVEGEVLWRVPPLGLPSAMDGLEPEALDAYDAVRLFADRARRARDDFALTATNAEAVAELVRRLDGMPLAIELAAARVNVLLPEQILAGLDDRFPLLSKAPRSATSRHRSLEASVVWSHDLLTEPERIVLRRLGVFAASFTGDAAIAVSADEMLDSAAVFDLLDHLVDKSLVQADHRSGSEVRYSLLKTIQAFALDRLAEAGEVTDMRAAHLDWFATLIHEAEAGLTSGSQAAWLDRLELEHPDLTAALTWATNTGRHEVVMEMAADLTFFWVLHGHFAQGERMLRGSIEQASNAPDALRRRARWSLGDVCYWAGDIGTAHVLGTEVLEEADRVGDAWIGARAAWLVGIVELILDPPTSRPRFEDAAARARVTGDQWCVVVALESVALTNWSSQPDDIVAFIEEAEAITDAVGCPQLVAWNCVIRQRWAMHHGELDVADAYYQRGIAASSAIGDTVTAAQLAAGHGEALIQRGRLDEARQLLFHRVDDLRAHGADGFVPLLMFIVALSYIGNDAVRAAEALDIVDDPGTAPMFASLADAGRSLLATESGEPVDPASLGPALETARYSGNPWILASQLVFNGRAVLPTDVSAADALFAEALGIAVANAMPLRIADTLEAMGAAAVARARDRDGARLIGAASTLRRGIGVPVPEPPTPFLAAAGSAATDRIGQAEWATAVAQGATMTVEQAVAYATRAGGARGRPTSGWSSLTAAEGRVAALVAEGMTNPQIAEKLFIATGTVKTHVRHIFEKLNVTSRAELAAVVTRRSI